MRKPTKRTKRHGVRHWSVVAQLDALARRSAAAADALAMAAESLHSAIARLERVCPAACSCARGNGSAHAYSANTTWRTLSIKRYLARVYPAAAEDFATMLADQALELFKSLHFYYDHGLAGCAEPGAVVRFLYTGFLPCSNEPPRSRRTVVNSCVSSHFTFAPRWVREIEQAAWVEVEHRAIGFAVRNPELIPGLSSDGAPKGATAFMDAGPAGMWYLYRKGSGIFYRMGRTMIAPGKTAMMARLLDEFSREADRPEQRWMAFAGRSGLFAASAPSLGPRHDSQRLRSIANGSAHCAGRGVAHCRCQSILHDVWDDAMIWLARVLRYETLFFTATLLCHQMPNSSFTTAYPELVDVRPMTVSWTDAQGHGFHPMLLKSPSANKSLGESQVYTLRKDPVVAEDWIDYIKKIGVLSLRHPMAPADETRAKPCNFSVSRWSLQCVGHISALWPESQWHSCAIPMCGFKGMWVGGGRIANNASLLKGRASSTSNLIAHRPSPSAAICITGVERTLLSAPVVTSFYEHVIGSLQRNFTTDVDIHISLVNATFTQPRELKQRIQKAYSTASVQLSPTQSLTGLRCELHGSHLAGPNGSVSYSGTEKRAQRHAKSILLQWVGIGLCYDQIVAAEQRRGKNYSLIFRTRSDVVYLQDLPLKADILSRNEVYVPLGGMTEKPEF
ncbi:MAG: hypothetical protein SGPRY_007770, partial [Prymnesium sp.]